MAVDTINTENIPNTATRTPLSVTFSVWKALFLREAVNRISHRRAAWLWLLMEPALHVATLMVIHTLVRPRASEGIIRPVWLMMGVLGWLTFMHTARQMQHAIKANKSFFSYRQVKPLDAVLVRGALEGFLSILVAVFCFVIAGLVGFNVVPSNLLLMLVAFVGIWLLGIGYGLITSVIYELIPEIGDILNILMIPLWLSSSVVIPVNDMAPPYRDWTRFNPLVHGEEAMRHAFTSYYHMLPWIDISYTYVFSLVIICLGLLLQNHFAKRLVAP